ncbi:DEAD/DEAH box helicase [Rhizobium sp. TRM96647]|uniref:DEAD/DEAH box helicase n=1 Tax=unclassified Rhizobium TaxID=2613769 RepID=UPI0021E83E77|nr:MULTISPECIES: DEAD/DEAH box helicase [unclassified Rhizobium]MCV3736835.1 DEAD/DEAH box helicase [Rhizobium sp. TRM96647]MCV3756765.1 DEAD/DEAH box helicase [Rhizobium sp. TRM96650]
MTDYERLVPAMASALAKRGYTTLTPVQKAVADPDLEGADLLVSAQTGSGKTVAFGLAFAPTLLGGEERFGRASMPLALAIAPTRELALQVKRELEWLYGETGAVIASCVGGMDIRTERRALERGAQIVVGTPGRLRDHIDRGALDLSGLKAVVLDEADEMLDLGFREDLEFILEAAPDERRTLMFSATVPRAIEELARNYQRDAVRVTTAAEKGQHGDIAYRALAVTPHDRENAIINVLRFYEAPTAIVFCSTRAAVNHLTARLNNRGFSVVALSGELSQNERTHALQAMRDGRARVCIATDVAARGIDLPNLELVVHADLPTNPETLLHRSGRTGRAGRKGVSALIVPVPAIRRAERLLATAKIMAEWANPPSADEILRRDDERLLADPILAEPVADDEAEFTDTLLSTLDARQIAAAFVRLYRKGRSAPEDLREVDLTQRRPARERRSGEAGDPAPRPPRDAFGPGRWISISVGRKQNAEPRWLIPMLCRAGGITRNEIGAIRMQQDETYVELAEASAEAFLERIGPKQVIEKGIRLTKLDGAPDMTRGKPAGDRPGRGPRKDREFAGERENGPRERASDRSARADFAGKPARKGWEKAAQAEGRSRSPQDRDERPGKPAGFKGKTADFKGKAKSFKDGAFADKPPRQDHPAKAASPKRKARKSNG